MKRYHAFVEAILPKYKVHYPRHSLQLCGLQTVLLS
jgi:hypothetical protein